MITIVITQDEKKIKGVLLKALRQDGYDVSGNWQNDNAIEIVGKGKSGGAKGLVDISCGKSSAQINDMVIELEDSLYNLKKGELYRAIMDIIERPMIEHTLERTEGNQVKAARILGINRNTIRAKIKRLGINVEQWKTL